MDAGNSRSHKTAAVQFLQLVVAGRIEEAYRDYVDIQGKHHNLYFPAGFPSLKKAMIEDHVQSPNKRLSVVNVLEERDLIAVHSHLEFAQGKGSMITVHLFRFTQDRIVEIWDCGQLIPPDLPNKDGPF